MFEKLFRQSDTRSGDLRHFPVYNLTAGAFSFIGIFCLFTNSNTIAALHQFGEVGIKRVIGKSSQRRLISAVIPFCKRNAELLTYQNRIVRKRFIKVTHPKE